MAKSCSLEHLRSLQEDILFIIDIGSVAHISSEEGEIFTKQFF